MGKHGGKAPIPPYETIKMGEHLLSGKPIVSAVYGSDNFCHLGIRV